jgi:AcrR family transcriptional regulator
VQVVTYMHTQAPRSTTPANTHDRILSAAARVFARHGLSGATTRVIAEEAGVNEVTLFRHFHTKDRLLAAVVGANFDSKPDTGSGIPAVTADIRADLLEHARRYDRLLTENLPLVRTMIGEIHHRHRDQESHVFRGIFWPIKAAIRTRIEIAQAAGDLDSAIRADVLADLFGGMIFTGVLRREAPDLKIDYPADIYLKAAVDLVVRGSQPRNSRRD